MSVHVSLNVLLLCPQVATVYVLRIVILKGKRRTEKEAHARLVHLLEDINFKGACLSKGFLVLIILYLKTSSTILQMFQCRTFEETSVGQERRLFADYARDCNATEYDYYYYLGLIFVLVYPVGVPVLFLTLMLKNKATIHDSINIQKYGFIFKDYGPVFFIWEIWELLRKLAMSGLLIFFSKGSADQISIAILFSTIALVLHARAFPYKDMSANWIQLGVLAGLELTLFGSLILKMDSREQSLSPTFVDIYLTSVNILIPAALCSVVAWEAQRAFTLKARSKLKLAKKKKRQQELLKESAGIELSQIYNIMQEEEREAAITKAESGPSGLAKLGGMAMKGTGASMLTMGALSAAKAAASKARMMSKNALSAKDLFPTLADERRAVKRLQFDKEKTEEASVQADHEAKDLGEWIEFAQSQNASENELMSFVRAFGDELLADINVHEVEDMALELGGGDAKGKKSSTVVSSRRKTCSSCFSQSVVAQHRIYFPHPSLRAIR